MSKDKKQAYIKIEGKAVDAKKRAGKASSKTEGKHDNIKKQDDIKFQKVKI